MKLYKKLLRNSTYAVFFSAVIGILLYVGIITFTLASGKLFYTWENNRFIAVSEFVLIIILIIGMVIHTYYYLDKKTR